VRNLRENNGKLKAGTPSARFEVPIKKAFYVRAVVFCSRFPTVLRYCSVRPRYTAEKASGGAT
jgi:hypothetical protein